MDNVSQLISCISIFFFFSCLSSFLWTPTNQSIIYFLMSVQRVLMETVKGAAMMPPFVHSVTVDTISPQTLRVMVRKFLQLYLLF